MFRRLALYFKEMFPLTSFVGSIVSCLGVELIYLRLHGIPARLSFALLIPALAVTLVTLLIRVMDEFKDYQDDLVNYPNRPLPSGRVERSDLRSLGIFCVVAVVGLSATSWPVFVWGLLTLGYTGLMLKWFFFEDKIRKSLPLAFVSHHPIVIFNFTYLIIACTQMYPQQVGWEMWYYIIPICLIYTNWEVMRKIRTPAQETQYTTYSMIFGPRPAIGVALILQVIFTFTLMAIFRKLGTPLWLQGIYLVLQLALMLAPVKFLFTLKLSGPLKAVAENQILLVVISLTVAAFL
ncbi:MAG TPA: hypothetical protein VNJ01_10125 [Bacteriovoracaceae bacterium]|nr:hypothetical protein [Bacteriovoracaceae bacterium]